MPYRFRDHTADLALVIEAPTLAGLFEEACRAFAAVLVADVTAIGVSETRVLTIPGCDPAERLVDLLAELLHAYESERLLLPHGTVEVRPDGLRVVARGEHLDEARHETTHEVKAVTYHGLTVRRVEGGFVAEVVLDV